MTDNTLPDNMRSLKDAAAFFPVHRDTLRRWAKEGRVTYYQLGKRRDLRFRQADLDELLDRKDKSPENGGPHSHGEER